MTLAIFYQNIKVMSEFNFDSPLNGGEHLLKEFVCGLMLFKGWEILKRGVCTKMKEYMPDQHPLIEKQGRWVSAPIGEERG